MMGGPSIVPHPGAGSGNAGSDFVIGSVPIHSGLSTSVLLPELPFDLPVSQVLEMMVL